jgi:hypothetical protein
MDVRDVVKVVRDNGGSYSFHPDRHLPAEDFQFVVELVQEAHARGYIEDVPIVHTSSQTGRTDLIVASGLTPAGEALLEDR